MRPIRFRFQLVLTAAAMLLVLAGAWYWLGSASRFDGSEFRDTAGIHTTVNGARWAEHGVIVNCTIRNETQRPAYSVVLTVDLLGENQSVIAGNPMVNVLDLKVGESRPLAAFVPLAAKQGVRFQPRARVSLVRWTPPAGGGE